MFVKFNDLTIHFFQIMSGFFQTGQILFDWTYLFTLVESQFDGVQEAGLFAMFQELVISDQWCSQHGLTFIFATKTTKYPLTELAQLTEVKYPLPVVRKYRHD